MNVLPLREMEALNHSTDLQKRFSEAATKPEEQRKILEEWNQSFVQENGVLAIRELPRERFALN